MSTSISAVDLQRARRRYAGACLLGAGCAAVLFTWMLNEGRFDFLQPQFLGRVFDDQAHGLLHGHWNVSSQDLSIEAFVVHGRAYTYMGPWPAILRMPVALVTSRFDGRLGQSSMLLAFAVAMAFASALSWRIRRLVRGSVQVTAIEFSAVAVYTFVLGAGSAIMFLSSRAFLYHEPELWGAAWTIAALDRVLAFTIRPTTRNLVLAALLATLAILTRGSVGLGAVVALGLVCIAQVSGRSLRALGVPKLSAPQIAGTGAASIIPVVAYTSVNYVKFGTLFSVPFSNQVFTAFSPARRVMLKANGGSLFGLKFVPTTLLQYVRPDALRLQASFPYFAFPPRGPLFGHVLFDARDVASSVPASMPLFTILAVVGFVAIFRSWPALRVPVLGAMAGIAPTLAIAYIANRYLADFMPFLVLTSLAGLHVALRWLDGSSRTRIRKAGAAFLVLAAASVVINVGLADVYQRSWNPPVAATGYVRGP